MQKFIFLLLLFSQCLNSLFELSFNHWSRSNHAISNKRQSTNKPQYMHFYVEQLNRQLWPQPTTLDLKKSIAVGTILPSSLKKKRK